MKALWGSHHGLRRKAGLLGVRLAATLILAALRVPAATEVPEPERVGTPDFATIAVSRATNLLHLNFRNAPVSLVLDYLSDAAGFVINQETELSGKIDAWSKDALTREEAVALLNSALRKNGAGVIRDGRILKIVRLDTAKTADLPVVQGNNPDGVENSEEVVTQIIPVRYANASQLVNNLQVLLPATASLSVNESANSLILVATKSEIRRMLKIISALDASIASVSTIKILPLKYGDAKTLATVLQQLFSPPTSNQSGGGRNQRFNMPGGFGPFGGPGGGFGLPGATAAAQTTGDTSHNAKVTVVADEYSNSLVVSAPADLVPTLTEIVKQVDQPMTDVTEMRVFRLKHADPSDLADQLSQLFPDESKSNGSGNQTDNQFRFGPPGPFGGPFGGGPLAQTSSGSSSERAKKKGRVLAVADGRTSSLLVTADSTLMPQIAKMVEDLDASAARKEVVKVYDLRNADPQNVNQILQDLFNRNNTMRNNNNNRNSLLGQNNPLSSRETQQQQTGTQTGFGSAGGGTGGMGGFGGGAAGGGGGF